jgi:3'-phosphoadenosine 5'-phosphosulfate sulfotransferase (PAPS reductase)/FAD synthetase
MQLKMRQAMPLRDKIRFTQRRITEWVDYYGVNGCYVSFSGGKDSTVLLHIVRGLYPDIEAVFVDTGLEYPEIRQFVKSFDNVTILRPEIRFDKVLEKYGYPIVSKEVSEAVYNAKLHLLDGKKYKTHYEKLNGLGKYSKEKEQYACKQWKFLLDAPFKISNKCCNVMKKKPAHDYHKKTGKVPFIATMAEESQLREQKYLQQGCNGFKNKIPTSTPIAFWTEQDILEYIVTYNIPIASVYGDVIKGDKYYTTGCQRTGCMFCGYGCHLEKYPNRFQRLAKTHPRQYEYIINELGMGKVLEYIGVEYRPNIDKGQIKLEWEFDND